MSKLKVSIKKLSPMAVIPEYAKFGDAGMDLTATSKWYDDSGNVCYGTSLAFEIPPGHVGYVFPRSSNSKKDLLLSNSVGVIDSGYRGEVIFKFKAALKENHRMQNLYNVGDRIGQIIIMPIPQVEFNEVDTLEDSERGQGGFGSSGQ